MNCRSATPSSRGSATVRRRTYAGFAIAASRADLLVPRSFSANAVVEQAIARFDGLPRLPYLGLICRILVRSLFPAIFCGHGTAITVNVQRPYSSLWRNYKANYPGGSTFADWRGRIKGRGLAI